MQLTNPTPSVGPIYKLWKTSLQNVIQNSWSFPEWLCPYCHTGTLDELEVTVMEDEASKRNPNPLGKPIAVGKAIGILKCGNEKCKETTALIGTWGVMNKAFEQPNGKGRISGEIQSVYPLYFFPSLYLIPIHGEYPANVRIELGDAFPLYWNDFDACAQKLRNCVEFLLTAKEVPIFSKKKEVLPVHNRIEMLPAEYDSEKSQLLSLNIIGQPGSPGPWGLVKGDKPPFMQIGGRMRSSGQETSEFDLQQAFEILDRVLTRLFLKEAA
jgi:hypothetical protein